MPTDTPGLTFGKPERKMGLNGSHTYAVSIENVTVPMENLLGREGQGLHQTLEALDGGRIAIGALSVGLAQAAYEAAVAYAKERKTFGKPMAEHQAIQEKIANMATTIEAARWLVYRAAWTPRSGPAVHAHRRTSQAVRHRDRRKSLLRRHPDPRRLRLQPRVPVERIYRDNRLMSIGEGTSEIQRMVITRNVFGVSVMCQVSGVKCQCQSVKFQVTELSTS